MEPLLPSKNITLARCLSRPDDELKHFRRCLRFICVDQSNALHSFISWSLFILLAIVVPLLSHLFLESSHNRKIYDDVVQLSLTAASSLAFLCLSASLRKLGLRRFLFLHKIIGASENVKVGYTSELNRSFRLLSCFVLPCFLVESGYFPYDLCSFFHNTRYKVWCYSEGGRRTNFLGEPIASNAVSCTLELASWIYRTMVFFLVCVLFRLICHLQILRLEDFVKLFQEESNVVDILQAHLEIRKQLMVISHRFRRFIVGEFAIVTASQFAALLLTLRPSAVINLFSTGELAICSVGLVTGLFICLKSAAKITHKAQAITSHAAKWHIISSVEFCNTDPETPGQVNYEGDFDDFESDKEDSLEETEIVQPLACTISFQKRQALVTYLENNKAGIAVYGNVLDRGSLHAIFMFELSLVLWLLGKTIGIS